MSGDGNGGTTMAASATGATRTTPMQEALREQEARVSEIFLLFFMQLQRLRPSKFM